MKVAFGDWSPDQPELENKCLEAKNVIPYAGRYTQVKGLASVSDALPGKPLASISTSIIESISETYVGTATNLYRLAVTSWDDVSPMGLVGTTAWSFCQFGIYILAASYENLLQFVEIASTDLFADIADSPKARCVGAVRNFVVCGDIVDPTDGAVPWRVRWSAIDSGLDWPLAGTNDAYAKQSDQQDLKAEDGAVKAIVGTEYGLIFQEKAISRMSYVGSPLVFQIDRIDSTRGALSSRSVVNVGRTCYFPSRDGFFANDGSGESVSIGHGKVDQWFLAQINDNSLESIIGAADRRRKIIYWTFSANGNEIPNRVIIYNYAEQRWSYAEVTLTDLVYARQAGYTLEDLDAFGTLDTIDLPFDDPFWGPGGQFLAAFDSEYKLSTFGGGPPLTAVLETGEFCLEGRRSYLSGIRPLVTGNTQVQIALGTRQLMGAAPVWTSDRVITQSTGQADFRSSSFYFRARCTIPGGFTDAIGVDSVEARDDAGR